MRRIAPFATAGVLCLLLAGSAMGAGRLYAPSYGSGPPEVIAGFDLAADGSLSPVDGSPFPLTSTPPDVGGAIASAFAPEGERAAVSFLFNGGIQALSIAANGAVAPSGQSIVTPSATGLAVSPDGRFAYIPTRDFMSVSAVGIIGYAFGADGSLSPLPGSPYESGEFGDVAITPDGRFLYALVPNQVQRFSIGENGALTPLGNTPLGGVQTLNVSPDGRLLFVAVDGFPSDGVASLSIGADGGLAENGDPAPTGDVSLDYFAVAPDGDHVYMPDSNNDGGLATAAVADDGTLSVIDDQPIDDIQSAGVSPDGRFLYLHQQSSDQLRVASLGANGIPQLLPHAAIFDSGEPVRLHFQPQPTPVAAFKVTQAPPGKPTRFDGGRSERTARYDWDFGDGTVLADGGPTPEHTYEEAGKYGATLTVTDAQGCSAAQVYTGQSTSCPGGPDAVATKRADSLPVLSKLKVKPRRFAVDADGKGKAARGTTFRYRLSEKAKVKLKIERKQGNRFKGVGKLKDKGKAGKNRKRFSGVLRGGELASGSYRVSAVAKDAAGGKSKRRRASFRVVG